jgi:hypothetical protein
VAVSLAALLRLPAQCALAMQQASAFLPLTSLPSGGLILLFGTSVALTDFFKADKEHKTSQKKTDTTENFSVWQLPAITFIFTTFQYCISQTKDQKRG